jgi:hypothetical protein
MIKKNSILFVRPDYHCIFFMKISFENWIGRQIFLRLIFFWLAKFWQYCFNINYKRQLFIGIRLELVLLKFF